MNDADGCFSWNACGSIPSWVEINILQLRVDIEITEGFPNLISDPWIWCVIRERVDCYRKGML